MAAFSSGKLGDDSTARFIFVQDIALLISETATMVDGNYLRFGNELFARGINVSICFVDQLALVDSQIVAHGFKLTEPMVDGDLFPPLNIQTLKDFTAIWVLSLGYRESFLDKMQLLNGLEDVRMINSLNALMHLKSKYFLASKPELFNYPSTFASTQPDELYHVLQSGGKWIAKPPAGSLGRDVFLLSTQDPNARVILQTLCGTNQDQYTLLQQYVPEIEQGEKRILFAGGEVVGHYLRKAVDDHRTNIMQGAGYEPCNLTNDEASYCARLGNFLKDYGAEFVGLDLAYPWLIEFNVINPGGLLTIEELTKKDLSPDIIDRIFFMA